MKKEAKERASIKLEIPLPKLPSAFRFSLKAMLLVMAVVAACFAFYRHGRDTERRLYYGGHFTVFVVGSDGSSLTTLRRSKNPSIQELVESNRNLLWEGIHGAYTWPPKVWIERPDWSKPELRRVISVDCGGTEEEPTFGQQEIKIGDSVFIDLR